MTGNVDGDTLVKKILKSGKYAELILPEIANKDEKKTGKQKNNEKKKDAEDGKDDNDEQKNLTEDPESADKNAGGDNSQDASGNEQPLSNGGESKDAGDSGGAKKKKSKKKGQKPNPSNGGGNDHTSNNEVQPVNPMNLSLPQQQMYPYPPLYYPNPTLLYGISYSSANPISNGTCHFAPPMHPHSYSYTGRYLPPPPSDPVYDNYSDSDESGCYIM